MRAQDGVDSLSGSLRSLVDSQFGGLPFADGAAAGRARLAIGIAPYKAVAAAYAATPAAAGARDPDDEEEEDATRAQESDFKPGSPISVMHAGIQDVWIVMKEKNGGKTDSHGVFFHICDHMMPNVRGRRCVCRGDG